MITQGTNDLFSIHGTAGHVDILGYNLGQNIIQFDHTIFSDFKALSNAAYDSGTSLIATGANGSLVTIEGLHKDQLTAQAASSFQFM